MGVEAQQILDKSADWTEKIYDMSIQEVKDYLHAQGEDCNQILYIEYSYTQIGKTEEWLKNISQKIQDPLTVRREILLQRLHGSSDSPFSQEDIEYIVQMEHKPIDELWLDTYYKFDVYKKLNKRKAYMIGIDCATGTSGDNNAITVLDPTTIEPVAEFESSYIGETAYENLIIRLVDYLPKSCVIIERNSMGDAIIDHLLHSKIAGRLYFDKAKDLVEEKIHATESVESMLKKRSKIKTYYGVYTDSRSRNDMFEILARHVNEYKEKFITHNITRDISRLIRKSNGRIEAGPGFHDDSIMSYLLAMYVYYHGNNLGMFGIVKGATDEELDNSGLLRPEEVDPSMINFKALEEARVNEEKIKNTKKNNWDDIMAAAIKKSQAESRKLYESHQISNTIYDSTPRSTLEDIDDDNDGNIPLDFFNDMNNF